MNSLPPVARNVQSYQWEKVQTQTMLPRHDTSALEFEIEGRQVCYNATSFVPPISQSFRDDSFVDVKNIQQVIQLRIKKLDDKGNVTNLAADDKVVPYNGFLYTMWQDIQLDFQHKNFYKSWDHYQIITYLQLLYGTPEEQKKTILTSALWYIDESGSHSTIQKNAVTAPGEYQRSSQVNRSELLTMQGRLILDPLNVARPILNKVNMKLRYIPNVPKKCLLVEGAKFTPVIEIIDFYLLVPRLRVKSSLLTMSRATYPYVHNEVVRFVHPALSQTFLPRTIYNGPAIPKRVIVVLWTDEQNEGKLTKNRLELNHYNIDQLLIVVNNEELPMHKGFVMDFANDQYSTLYQALFQELASPWMTPSGIDVPYTKFAGGFVVFPVALTSNKTTSTADYYSPLQSGTVELQMHFAEPPGRQLHVLCILQSEKIYSFDAKRNCVEEDVTKLIK